MPFTFPSVTVSAVAVSVVLFVNLTVVPSASGAVTLPRAVPLTLASTGLDATSNSAVIVYDSFSATKVYVPSACNTGVTPPETVSVLRIYPC